MTVNNEFCVKQAAVSGSARRFRLLLQVLAKKYVCVLFVFFLKRSNLEMMCDKRWWVFMVLQRPVGGWRGVGSEWVCVTVCHVTARHVGTRMG